MDKFRRPTPSEKTAVPVSPSVWGSNKAGDTFIESASFTEAGIERPKFALDRWEYNTDHLRQFIKGFSRGNDILEKMLVETFESGGGKAFGLKICEFVAENLKDIVYRLSVPPYEVISSPYTINEADNDLYRRVIRSSSPEEDWVDPRSGVLPSFNGNPYRFGLLKQDKKLSDVPHIIQEMRHGIGCVIDVGFSPVHGKVVARIAYGNIRKPDELRWEEARGHYTSATEDTEASVGIWDAESGIPLAPTVNFGHKSMQPDNLRYRNTLVPLLFAALKKTGIDFGVQLECIADPTQPHDISLVQIRPTPERIYQQVNAGKRREGKSDKKSEVFAQSPIVNGSFDVSGSVEFFDVPVLEKNYQSGQSFSSDTSDRSKSGIIGVYATHGMSNLNIYKPYHTADIYLGGYLSGSDVQITPRSFRPNSHHGLMEDRGHDDAKYNFLDGHCGMMHLHEDDIARLKKILEADPTLALNVKSDGLIGEISIVKPKKK